LQVQWYERRANMPAHLQEGMHDREVAEWLQTDTNLVGCIERKARVVKAPSYEKVRLLARSTLRGWEGARLLSDGDCTGCWACGVFASCVLLQRPWIAPATRRFGSNQSP
jgi:hypothetical protein